MPRFGGMGGAFGHMGGWGRVPAASAAFSPLDLTPALWIDPSDTATMFQSNAGTTTVTDGSVCGYAGDKSGAAFHLTSVADDSARPTWNNNSGLPYLNFDGINDLLRRTADLGCMAGSCSMFFALKANPANNTTLFGLGNSADADPIYEPYSNNGTPSTGAFFISNTAGVSQLNATTLQANAFDNTDNVYGIVDDTTSITPYLDGVAGTAANYTRSGSYTFDRTTLCGLIRTTTAGQFVARIYGVIIVLRAVSASEIASLTTYLGAKMGRVL